MEPISHSLNKLFCHLGIKTKRMAEIIQADIIPISETTVLLPSSMPQRLAQHVQRHQHEEHREYTL